jgi:hypothetical protein
LGGGVYRKELLERIRDIRAGEKVMYRQVLDLYATSLDYNATIQGVLTQYCEKRTTSGCESRF